MDEKIQACMQHLRRIVKALDNYSRAVEKHFNLTGPQLWALWEVGQHGSCALKELAERMKLDPSTVVGVVDRLEAKGLLCRQPDPKDRRRISLVLTAGGETVLAQAPHPAQGHLLRGLASLGEARVEALNGSLEILVKVMEAEHLEAPFFFAEG
nr:MarR family transcriptional regulator [uncultured Holophaga sp.]